MNKKSITRNFSRNAESYDDHAAVQRKCAEKLIGFIGEERFSCILEIGCGTGIYTRLLRDRYKDAEITAIDISEKMIKIAREKSPDKNISFMIADGEQMTADEKLDLITSNASFQWFEDIERTFGLFARILADSGVLCFSMYGPETFSEFRKVLGVHFGRRHSLSSGRFPSREEMEVFLGRHFGKFSLVEERFTAEFLSLWDFLGDIKKSGTRGEGLGGDVFLGKYTIKELERTYIKEFGSITATHHVYFCRAQV
jgi:malonyl-CoA O-methyltransferase